VPRDPQPDISSTGGATLLKLGALFWRRVNCAAKLGEVSERPLWDRLIGFRL
jgi:hypothetical protein